MGQIKFIIYFVTLVLGIVLCPVFGVAQDEITTVDDSAFSELMRPKVIFPHQLHTEMKSIKDCNVCHHVYQDGVRIEDNDSIGVACSGCHYDGNRNTIFDLIRVYHLQCKGCHMRQKAGPVLCGECHRKE